MAWNFRRRVKLLPGVTLNIGKRGVSTSIGPRGARVTYGHGKRRTTVGIPGTGISHTAVKSTTKGKKPSKPASEGLDFGQLLGLGIVGLFVALIVFGWLGLI